MNCKGCNLANGYPTTSSVFSPPSLRLMFPLFYCTLVSLANLILFPNTPSPPTTHLASMWGTSPRPFFLILGSFHDTGGRKIPAVSPLLSFAGNLKQEGISLQVCTYEMSNAGIARLWTWHFVKLCIRVLILHQTKRGSARSATLWRSSMASIFTCLACTWLQILRFIA